MDPTIPERDRTDESLRNEREETDLELIAQRAAAETEAALVRSRQLALEHASAERAERERALRDLLMLEREQTDEHLRIERERADDAIMSRDHFLGMVTHDLRDLLGGIAMSAAGLKKIAADDVAEYRVAVERHVERLQRHTTQMHRLVRDLHDIAGIQVGQVQVLLAPYETSALVMEIVRTFRTLADAKGITLNAITTGAELASLDRGRILQVLENLVRNALQSTQTGGSVTVGVEAMDQQFRFTVLDNGPGVRCDDIDAIFNGTWDVSTPERRALGIGLYLSKAIVEAHGGVIWCESVAGQGTLFSFTLPRTR